MAGIGAVIKEEFGTIHGAPAVSLALAPNSLQFHLKGERAKLISSITASYFPNAPGGAGAPPQGGMLYVVEGLPNSPNQIADPFDLIFSVDTYVANASGRFAADAKLLLSAWIKGGELYHLVFPQPLFCRQGKDLAVILTASYDTSGAGNVQMFATLSVIGQEYVEDTEKLARLQFVD